MTRSGLAGTRATWGVALLLVPDKLLGLSATKPTRGLRIAVRVLGARNAVEGAVIARSRAATSPGWAVAVDLAHSFSMVVLGAASRRLRRCALTSAAVAGALAAAAVCERRTGAPAA